VEGSRVVVHFFLVSRPLQIGGWPLIKAHLKSLFSLGGGEHACGNLGCRLGALCGRAGLGEGPERHCAHCRCPKHCRLVAPARTLTSGMLRAHSQAAAFSPLTAPPSARERAAPGPSCRTPPSLVSAACMSVDGMAGGGKPVAHAVRSILTSPDSKAVRKAISTVCDFHERAKSEPSPRLLLAMLAACRATGEWRRAQTLLRKLRAPVEEAGTCAVAGPGQREQGSSSWRNEGASIAIGACARWGPEEVRCCWAQIVALTA
jgi:hypothetical protein